MQVEPTISAKANIYLSVLNNEIVESEYEIHHILPIVLEGDAKVEHDNTWRTYCEIIAQI